MSVVKFKRRTTHEISSLPVEDGSIIVDIENGKLYTDYYDNRITLSESEVIEQDGWTIVKHKNKMIDLYYSGNQSINFNTSESALPNIKSGMISIQSPVDLVDSLINVQTTAYCKTKKVFSGIEKAFLSSNGSVEVNIDTYTISNDNVSLNIFYYVHIVGKYV